MPVQSLKLLITVRKSCKGCAAYRQAYSSSLSLAKYACQPDRAHFVKCQVLKTLHVGGVPRPRTVFLLAALAATCLLL